MEAETLQLISIICYIIAGILLVTAVVLFIVHRIPNVFGELSGLTAKRAIADIQRSNLQRDKAMRREAAKAYARQMTLQGNVEEDDYDQTEILPMPEEYLIDKMDRTDVLSQKAAAKRKQAQQAAPQPSAEMWLDDDPDEETVILQGVEEDAAAAFAVLEEYTFVGTREVIDE